MLHKTADWSSNHDWGWDNDVLHSELTTGIASPIVPGGLFAYKPDTRYWELKGPSYAGRIYDNEVTYLKYADHEVWKMPDQTGTGGWAESSTYFDTRSGVKLRTVVTEFKANGSKESKITSYPNGNWEKVNYLDGGLNRTEEHDVLRREVRITNDLPGNDSTEIVLTMNARGTAASSFVKLSGYRSGDGSYSTLLDNHDGTFTAVVYDANTKETIRSTATDAGTIVVMDGGTTDIQRTMVVGANDAEWKMAA